MWKTKFSSHKQYLFGLLFSRNANKTQKYIKQSTKISTNQIGLPFSGDAN